MKLTIIVPTFQEVENLPFLIPRVASVLADAGLQGEILIVDDDSRDGTVELCRRMAAEYPIRLMVRERERGLSSAVVHGMRHAQGDVFVVMDADLSHPPEKIPELVAALDNEDADFAIGSRYVPGGRADENWGVLRRLNSKIATLLARPLTSARDPMAGFFAIRRETFLQADALDPIGYKIGLELMVKCGCEKVQEVPIHFRDRRLGTSKLSFREQINYLVHLLRLFDYRFEHLSCPVKFCLVGATGLGVDLVMFTVLLGFLPLFIARALAIWIAMSWNFVFNRQFTFRTDRHHRGLKQYGLFCASCLGGAVVSWGVSVGLSHQTVFFGGHPLLAAVLGVVAGTGLNYLFSRHVTFRLNPSQIDNATACRHATAEISARKHNAMTTTSTGLRASLDSFAKVAGWRTTRNPILLVGLLLGVMLGLRLLAMALVPLISEEAYYWMYSQHPNLSYYDHPPMVAWVIGLGTSIFGDTEFGVRIVGNLMMLGASLLMYLFAREWFSRAAGVIAALALQILPVYFGVGFIATMDSALIFFWMFCLVGITAALRRDRAWGWYVAGFALGAAMLSKYTGVFLAAGAVLSVIAYQPWRRHLRTIHPYIALLLAAALFSPVLIWNAQHDWASIRFQFLDRFGDKPLNLKTIGIFIGILIAVATPMVLWLYLSSLPRLMKTRRLLTARWLVVLSFSTPLLLVMAYKSLRYEIHINWMLPALLSMFPAVSQMFIAQLRRLRTDLDRRHWARQLTWTGTICLVINIAMPAYLLVLQPHLHFISAFGPWERLARLVEPYEDRLEAETGREPLMVADGKYRLSSVLAFYRKPIEHDVNATDYTTSQWILGGEGLGYEYWSQRNDWAGFDCIYVTDDKDIDVLTQLQLREHFASVELVEDARMLNLGRKRYSLAICRGFRTERTMTSRMSTLAGRWNYAWTNR